MMKKITTLVLLLSILFTPVYQVRAEIWGTNAAAAGLDNVFEIIREEIVKAINSSVKMMAIKQTTSMIETILYGGNSSPRNIKNFRKFLFEDTRDAAVAHGETFLTNAIRGTTSGDYSGGDNLGLDADIEKAGKAQIDNWKGKNQSVVDYASSCGSDTIFGDGNSKCFAAIMKNPINTPFGMAIAVDAVIAAKEKEEKEQATLKATASGGLPAENSKTGDVDLPLHTVVETQLQRITMPLEALANADSSVFSSVIQSFVVGLVVGVVEKGLSEVEQSVDDAVQSFEDSYAEAMGPVYDAVGPAVTYASDAYDTAQKIQSQASTSPSTSSTSDGDESGTTSTWTNPDTEQPWTPSTSSTSDGDESGTTSTWTNPDTEQPWTPYE